MSDSQKRISGALLAGAALIAGALLVRSYSDTSNPTTQDTVLVAKAPQRSAIKVTDKNNDGVPDWQEALLVNGALDIASTTDSFKEPETLTEKFALEFFEDMVRAENYGAFGDTPEELVMEASSKLAAQAVDVMFTRKDILTSSDNTPDALATYGETVALITTLYPDVSSDNEAVILERALRDQNPTELVALDTKIAVYKNILQDTKMLVVPTTMQKEHLDLINSYNAVLTDIQAMRTAFTDPMLTLLRMKRYQADVAGLNTSFSNIFTKLRASGTTWKTNSPVYLFIQ